MLRDTDDSLLCPECGERLWIGVRQFFYGPAYYSESSNDHINPEAATKWGAMETTYTALWCQRCTWTTGQVDEYMEAQDEV